MPNFISNLPHMVMGVVVIAAVTILSLNGTISGGEALGVIGAASGFTMGASAGSTSPTVVGGPLPAPSVSVGQTATETVTHSLAAAPVVPIVTQPSN